jgi:hypothetical protein
LKSNTTYEWYATVSDGNSTTTGPVSQFTTATNFPLIPPSVTLVSPTNSNSFLAPASITISAAASDPDGVVTNVALYQGDAKLADISTAPYTFAWNNVAAGSYALAAVSFDDDGLTSTSSVVNITVTNSPGAEKLQGIGKIFVIAMENHNFTQPNPTSSPQQIFANSAAPYINSLITPGHANAVQVSYARRYFAAAIGAHPSEANYVWAEAATDFGVHTDADPSVGSGNIFNAPHLTRQLNAAGISWRNYQEDVQLSASPTNSASGVSVSTINPYYGNGQYNYAVKHNPMAFFTDTQTQNVFPFTSFLSDLSNNVVARYTWITPNQYNDQHSPLTGGFNYHVVAYTGDQAAIAQGDNFLSILVPQIMASSAYQSNGLIIIWWDETEGGDTTNFTIPEIIISPLAKGNAYASDVELNHSSDIKTMNEIFGLSFFSNAIPAGETSASGVGYNYISSVNDLSDLFRNLNSAPVAQNASFTRARGQALKIDIALLLSNYTSDPDLDPRSLVAVGSSAQGATISTNTDFIFYTPASDDADTFSYTIADGHGGTAIGNINVLVVNPGGIPQSIAVSNGVVNVQFAGIPGYVYEVQQSSNLVYWVTKTNFTAPPNGLFLYVEQDATSPSFYRLIQH